jgi:hypothetical protein
LARAYTGPVQGFLVFGEISLYRQHTYQKLRS